MPTGRRGRLYHPSFRSGQQNFKFLLWCLDRCGTTSRSGSSPCPPNLLFFPSVSLAVSRNPAVALHRPHFTPDTRIQVRRILSRSSPPLCRVLCLGLFSALISFLPDDWVGLLISPCVTLPRLQFAHPSVHPIRSY